MKNVVITGATGVLCSTIAKKLAKDGYRVVLLARNKEKLSDLQNEILADGGIALSYTADVTDETQLKAAHQAMLESVGYCDILINGAGGNHPSATTQQEYCTGNGKDFFELKQEGFAHVFNLNLWGTVLPCQIFAEDMVGRENCCILNISSMAALSPLTKTPAYCAAKAGISNFTQWLAVHLAPVGIRVNGIAPGFFQTNQNKQLLFNEDGTPSSRAEKILRNTPMNRFGKPEELLGAVKFLLDAEAAAFVTGCILPVDGGFSAYSGV